MSTQITFGKFKNWKVEDLAKAGETGRNYLAWGAENLRSPKWRKIFSAALTETTMDVHLAANVLVTAEKMGYRQARAIIEENVAHESEMAQEFDRYQQARDELHDGLYALGVTSPRTLSVISRWIRNGEIHQIIEEGQLKFENIDREQFMVVVARFEAVAG